jgi:DNA-binding transcriptional ArsR family regulator
VCAPGGAARGGPAAPRLSGSGPLSIARLTEGTEVSRQAVSKHLRVLEEAGLVRGERRGRESRWELETQKLEQARRALDQISQRWDDALARLKASLEREG